MSDKTSRHLSDERFARLEESLQQMLEHVSGEGNDLRTTILPVPSHNKTQRYVSDEEFAEIKLAFEQALEHARGERHDFRTTVLPVPPRKKTRRRRKAD